MDAAAREADALASVAAASDPQLDDLWARAREGEVDDLARLADREGTTGLILRAKDAAFLRTALMAMAYTGDLTGLPWLADTAAGPDEGDANAALASAAELASNPRRSVDPEDALEVRDGCDKLVLLAKDTVRSRARRVGALRALRMLSDRGCAPADLPTDTDTR